MKKRSCFILFVLIISFVLSSCATSTAEITITPTAEVTGAVSPGNSKTAAPAPTPAQSNSAGNVTSKSAADLLKKDVPESENKIMIDTLRDYPVPNMFSIYLQETAADAKKTILRNIVIVCERTDRYYDLIYPAHLTAAELEDMDEAAFEIVIFHHFDSGTEQILRTMDKDKLWEKLYPFLTKGDTDTASLIGQLNYPEYSGKIQAFLKSGNQYASSLTSYLQPPPAAPAVSPTPAPTAPAVDPCIAGLKYKKKGKSGGPIDSIIIIDHYYDPDWGEWSTERSGFTDSLVSADKQGYRMDSDLDAVIYVKRTYKYGGKYYFKELHKKSKGYRVGYKIVLVDLRTKHVLATKTLAARKLPRYIYDSDLADNGKYYTNPPSSKKLAAALKSLLKKYKCLDEDA